MADAEVIKEAKHAQVFTLDTNYRSTKPIIDVANNILGAYTKDYLPKSINRKGDDPVINTFKNNEEMLNDFEYKINEDLKDLNKSIGIICYSDELLEDVHKIMDSKNIPDEVLIKLQKNSKINYLPKAVYITHFDNCKGLEFSKIYILGLNLENVKTFSQAKEAFVAVTRAMNEISILGVK